MLAGSFNYQTKEREIDEYICPWTLVFTFRPQSAAANVPKICIMNYENENPVEIDWGDGSEIQEVYQVGSGDSFAQIQHTYDIGSSLATVKIRMNGPLDLDMHSWFVLGSTNALTNGTWKTASVFSENANFTYTVIDWNRHEMFDMLCRNLQYSVNASPFSCGRPTISNHLLHELLQDFLENDIPYEKTGIAFFNIVSDTRDLVFEQHKHLGELNYRANIPNFDSWPTYKDDYTFYHSYLERTTIPNLTYIPSSLTPETDDTVSLFYMASMNERLDLSQTNWTFVPKTSFKKAIGIKDIILPSTLLEIGNQAFYGSDLTRNRLSRLIDDIKRW